MRSINDSIDKLLEENKQIKSICEELDKNYEVRERHRSLLSESPNCMLVDGSASVIMCMHMWRQMLQLKDSAAKSTKILRY